MCINIVEVSWKAKLKQAFPDPNSYSAFMGNFSSATGTVTLIMMLLGRSIFQKFGWRTAALVTPTVSSIQYRAACGVSNGEQGKIDKKYCAVRLRYRTKKLTHHLVVRIR